MPRQKGIKPIAHNKKAFHEFFVEDRYECGMSLRGTEVKSVRDGRVNLKESFCMVRQGELFAEGMHISPYKQGNIFNADPLRPKKLLMHKSEIKRLTGKLKEKGYTLVPLRLYFKSGRVKIELALAKGKAVHDKRKTIQKRDMDRDMQREIKRYT
ncbi:MAG TPA: SsrA-binding protein SmpB [Candidatus Limiplasma sp.]|nr:SsrA-binding protein SmpB [Candidatus Limiplasma sp.]